MSSRRRSHSFAPAYTEIQAWRIDVAVKVGRQLFAGAFGQIHHATAEEEQASFEYLAKHRDKQYSFVDCLSFVVMENLGVREAFAVDRHFTHRFVALPGPQSK